MNKYCLATIVNHEEITSGIWKMELAASEIARSAGPVFSCGPRQMLKSVSAWAKEHSIPIQVSMEERMACGIGACLGCGVKIQKPGEPDWKYLRVCKDGPVFSGEEVVWDE